MDAPMTQAEPGKSIKVEFVKNSEKKNFMFFAKELEKGGALSRTTPSGDSFSPEGFLSLKADALSSSGPVRFIKMIDLDAHVMIFFTEETENGESASRVATICKNDDGGSLSVLTKKFTTFIKTTLTCPVKDDFSFSIMTAVSDTIEINGADSVLVSFTSSHGIPGSNVCAFAVDEIKDALFGTGVDFDGAQELNPWKNTPQENPANCLVPATGSYQYLQYIERSSSLSDHSPKALDGGHLLIRTTFSRPEDRDLITQVEIQKLNSNNETAIVVMSTTNGKLLRGILKLRNVDRNKLTAEIRRFEFLSESDVFLPEECQNGIREIEDLELFGSAGGSSSTTDIFVSMPGCAVKLSTESICASFDCKIACDSSGDPGCSWDDQKSLCTYSSELMPRSSTYQLYSTCPKKNGETPFRTVSSSPIYKSPKIDSDESFAPVQSPSDSSMSNSAVDAANGPLETASPDEGSVNSTTILLIVMLVVGILIGGVFQFVIKKCAKTGNNGEKVPEVDVNLDGMGANMMTAGGYPIDGGTLHRQKGERHPSVYENQQRVESTSSDSSRDSGIKSSEEEAMIPSSRRDFEYKIGFNNGVGTTGRMRERPTYLNTGVIGGGNNTIGHQHVYYTQARPSRNGKVSNTLSGSTNFLTTSSTKTPTSTAPGMSTLGGAPKPKLGTSSLRHYNTVGHRPGYQRSESCPRPGPYQQVANSPTRGNQHYPILRSGSKNFAVSPDNPANIYNISTINIDIEPHTTSPPTSSSGYNWQGNYQQNSISHYATLPKGQKRAQIRRTPSTSNGTLPRNQKPIPVLPPTVNHVFGET